MKATLALIFTSFLILTTSHAHAQSTAEDQAVRGLGTWLKADRADAHSTSSRAQAPIDDNENGTACGTSTLNAKQFKWCLQPTDRSKNPFVIYFFHGLTLNEHRWQEADFSHDLQDIWKAKGLTPPTIVTVSFGPVWLLTQTRDDKYDYFLNSIMPYFEKMLGSVTPAQRIVMGESMGGFNAAQLFLKSPQLFSRFVLQCPAVTQVGPFDPDSDLNAFIKRTSASPFLAYMTKIIGAYELQTEDQWLKHSPLKLASDTPSFPTKIYLSCGDKDHFGFYEGVDIMAKTLEAKTQELQYVFIPGGEHGTVDAQSMADFVSEDWQQ